MKKKSSFLTIWS